MPFGCIYPNCKTKKVVFRFPKEQDIFDKWLRAIPFVNFDNIDNEAVLCVDHFKKSDYQLKNKNMKLKKGVIPTIFQKPELSELNDNCCRFCLDSFKSKHARVGISETIKQRFLSITSRELKTSKDYSESICKKCDVKISKFYNFKNTLLNIQEIWYQSFGQSQELTVKKEEKKEEITFEESLVKLEDNEDYSRSAKEELSPLSFSLFDNFDEESLDIKDPIIDTSEKEDLKDEDYTPQSKKNPPKTEKKGKPDGARKYSKYICDLCGQEFKGLMSIRNHMFTHKQKDFFCQPCGITFETNGKFSYHKKRFHYKIRTSFICNRPECGNMEFESAQKLDRHKRNIHYMRQKVFCHLCGKSFSLKCHFEEHFRSKHSNERPFQCQAPECGKAFCSKSTLQQHMRIVHGEKKAVRCDVCLKIFKSHESIKKHMRYHLGVVFRCDYENCAKEFVSNHLLKIHKKIHLGQKDYVCQYDGCGHSYHNNVGLRKHIMSVHMKIRIPCEVHGCKSNFTRKEIYRNHVLSHHKDIGEYNLNALLLKIREMKLPKCQYTAEGSGTEA